MTLLPAETQCEVPPPLPEVAEIDLIRHFVNLSTRNMSIDTNFYPLGSCTMKYNPKRHERLAALSGMANIHPLQSDAASQGMLEMLWDMQNILAEIAGLDAVSLQPAAGAQGELTALLVAAAYFKHKDEVKRTRVLIPDSAHGTNPASAALAGFDAVPIKKHEQRSRRSRRPELQARRPRRRVHDYQSEHARPVRPPDCRDHARWCMTTAP